MKLQNFKNALSTADCEIGPLYIFQAFIQNVQRVKRYKKAIIRHETSKLELGFVLEPKFKIPCLGKVFFIVK